MASMIDRDVDTLGALYLLVSLFIVIILVVMCTVGAVTATKMFYSTIPGKMMRTDLLNYHCPSTRPPNIDIVVEGDRYPQVVSCRELLPLRATNLASADALLCDKELTKTANISDRLKEKASQAFRTAAYVIPDKLMPLSIKEAFHKAENVEQIPVYITADDALMIIMALVDSDTSERMPNLSDSNNFMLALKGSVSKKDMKLLIGNNKASIDSSRMGFSWKNITELHPEFTKQVHDERSFVSNNETTETSGKKWSKEHESYDEAACNSYDPEHSVIATSGSKPASLEQSHSDLQNSYSSLSTILITIGMLKDSISKCSECETSAYFCSADNSSSMNSEMYEHSSLYPNISSSSLSNCDCG